MKHTVKCNDSVTRDGIFIYLKTLYKYKLLSLLLLFSSISEANASEIPEHLEDIFARYYIYSIVILK